MKKCLKFLILFPCLFSVLCDPDDDDICGFDDPEAYQVTIENVDEFYSPNETIWFNAKTSSLLLSYCTEANEPEFVDDSELFLGGFFVLKLNENLGGLNAEVITEINTIYDTGENYSFNACSESVSILPVLSQDNAFYQYRVGVSVNAPGDYCVVSSRNFSFDLQSENNASVFDIYNTLDNDIKFDSCGNTYTRNGTDGHYFFRVE